ncbi:PEPxxWA-CTERM sorting domain-containing protein [Phenylobacterium sp.]|uniref:PEPxxWA-CTERM sorting domain-containing protein n=1 Tax=Phenylobacterium sp. TaxID=1871053 RepID=UPI0025D9DF8F|nr:PEPxxWA-CTERM sorting domain-containing protein [Phenylobacterium sp.]
MRTAILLASLAALVIPGAANASLVVTRFDNVAAGIAAFGASAPLLTWTNVFASPGAWTSGVFGGSSVVSFSATDALTGSTVSSRSGSLYITNWLDGPGFSAGSAATPDLAISGEEDFVLTFARAVNRIGFAVSTGVSLLPSEVRNTGSAFDVATDTTSAGAFTLNDPGHGAVAWIEISSLEPFRSITFTEDALGGDGIWDQYFGNVVTAGVPEPAGWTMLIAGFGLIGAGMRRRAARLAGA